MAGLTIVANIKAKAELEKPVDINRTEPCCINYDLHQDSFKKLK
jgi:quinol monooxygenase YgiN